MCTSGHAMPGRPGETRRCAGEACPGIRSGGLRASHATEARPVPAGASLERFDLGDVSVPRRVRFHDACVPGCMRSGFAHARRNCRTTLSLLGVRWCFPACPLLRNPCLTHGWSCRPGHPSGTGTRANGGCRSSRRSSLKPTCRSRPRLPVSISA